MLKNIKTHVVGLQFVEMTDSIIEELQKNIPLRLMHIPENPYDRNAIGVYLGRLRIGYIRRRHSKEFVRALNNSAWAVSIINDEPCSITKASRSFPVTIRIETKDPSTTTPPKIEPADACGIYRLRLVQTRETYIGQASHVNRRISEHWHDMALGVHANYKLQEYWIQYGSSKIEAELLASPPSGLTPHQQQVWLGEQERACIAREHAGGLCINLREGGLVHTASAKAEQELMLAGPVIEPPESSSRQADAERRHREWLDHEEELFLKQLDEALDIRHRGGADSPQRRQAEVEAELERIETDLAFLEGWKETLSGRVSTLEEKLRAPTGLKAFFTKKLLPLEIADLKARLRKAKRDLASVSHESGDKKIRAIALKSELEDLKS